MAVSISSNHAHSSTQTQQQPIEQKTGAQILCEALEQEGVEVMFGYPGGAIMPFYDALTSSSLKHILVRHEQAAAHAADGYARATGKVGVCVATSGPGATNLVTGLATAYMDSVPIVAITGQVARRFIGTDAFQETDVIGVTQPITKHSILVQSVDELAYAVHEAFAIARSGRPGPVLIDVPKDVQQATAGAPAPHSSAPPWRPTRTANLGESVARAATIIDQAERPLILAGHGIILSNAYDELRAFAERTGIPVVTTLLGISAIPESHPLALGMPGMHGRAEINHAIHKSDVLIAVGMRFDDRVTGNVNHFAPRAQIIHIDIDPSEMGKVLAPEVPIVADARAALETLTAQVQAATHDDWMAQIRIWQQEAEAHGEVPATPAETPAADAMPTPKQVLAAIRKATEGRALIVSDVGQHQMFAARFYGYEHPNTHLTSGGLGTMGFALPAAMGVAFGRPEQPIWVVAGDGGIQMNIQELATIAEFNIPIKVAIFNNGYLGMVRQWQQFFHQRNYSEVRITGPDYEKLAAAYGLTGMQVIRAGDVNAAIEQAMNIDGPVIIDFVMEQEANVFPMVPPGKGNVDMIHKAPTTGGNQ
jgi:acetolactate synthase-1/2/3 large subunit